MLDFFILEDEQRWLDIHKTTIQTALTEAKFEKRRKVGENTTSYRIKSSKNYDKAVQLTTNRKFDAYLVDGSFPMHEGEVHKHLLGVEFTNYLVSQGVSPNKIFLISSQHSMLEAAVKAQLPYVFAKRSIESGESTISSVRMYYDLAEVLKHEIKGRC